MRLDVQRFLADLTQYRARSYFDAVRGAMVAAVRGDRVALASARDRLEEVTRSTMGAAEVLGATIALQAAASAVDDVQFAKLPAQTILPRVTFEEALEDMVSRVPTTLRNAAERTAERISQLYSEGRVVAFVRAAEGAVTERAQALIAQAVREGVSEGLAGREITIGVDEIRRQTDDWSEAYSRMAFRTNVNTAATAGRFRQVRDPDVRQVIPAFRFSTAGDTDVRPNHRAADGLIFSADNVAWGRIAPPLGYNCRCDVELVTISQLSRMGRLRSDGKVVEDRLPRAAYPDPKFRHGGRPDLFLT